MSKENLTKEEKAQSKQDNKYAKLEAKYDKAYERKDSPKTKKIITAVVAVVVVIALLFAYVATGTVRKGMSASLGWPQSTFTAYTFKDTDGEKHKIKVSTYNYYFSMYYNNLKNTATQYSQYGLDLSQLNMDVDFEQKLSKQTRTEDDKTQTWLEYMQEQIKDTYMFYYMAVKDNDGEEPEITEDQQSDIDEALENYETSAKQYGFTLSGYLEAALGKGVNEEVFRRESKISYIAENYQTEYQEKLGEKEYDSTDLEAYRDAHLADLQSVDFKLFAWRMTLRHSWMNLRQTVQTLLNLLQSILKVIGIQKQIKKMYRQHTLI